MQHRSNAMNNNVHNTSNFAAGLLNPNMPTPSSVVGPHGKAANKRYNVYRNNVTVSLIESLADIFPAVQSIIGEDNFQILARDYVRAHPPSSPLLFQYGQEFATFIETFEPARAVPFLADIARMDRGWLKAYHAADIVPLDGAKLGQVEPEKLAEINFIAHPATFILQSQFPIKDIFLMNRGFAELTRLDMAQAQSVMFTRPETDIRVIDLNRGQFVFMNTLLEGQTLGEAVAHSMHADADFNLNTALQLLLRTGATIDITLNNGME